MLKYPKSLVRRTAGATRYRLCFCDLELFLDPPEAEEIAGEQTEKFNDVWAHALTLPFYRELAAEHRLPAVITSLDELEQWPALTREELVWQGMDRARSCTTSVPFSFPAGGTVLELPHPNGDLHTYEGWSLAEVVLDVHAIELVEHSDAVTILVVAPGIDRDGYEDRATTSVQATYPELKKGSVRLEFLHDTIPSRRGEKLLMVPEDNIDTSSLATVPLN